MKRDGQTISLWQHETLPYKTNTEELPNEADVVIVGGGITGLSTAFQLQLAGKTSVVIEAQEIGFGTTGGTTAHLNTLLDTSYYEIKNHFGEENAKKTAQITKQAIDLIEKNISEYSIDCGFSRKQAYLFSQNKEQSNELEKIVIGAKEVGINMQYSMSVPTPIPFESAAMADGQGQMHIIKYLYGIAEAFEKAGGRIIQNCRVKEHVNSNKETFLITSKGRIKAGNVVYATHIPPGINILHFRCAPYRSYAMAVRLKGENYPDALVYDLYTPYHYYRTQEVDGIRYLIAGGEDHKSAHTENTHYSFLKLESYIRRYFDVDRIAFQWSSQFFESVDGLPYIGHLPGNTENIFVATGFSGTGITYGVASAIILTELICNGTSQYKELFNPNRVKLVAGFENFVKEATDVVSVFIGRRFGIKEIEDAIELAKGEAKVVKYEGTSLALYKDEAGKLFALNPSCPHTKCVIGWNNAEKSWDCPCHGSRFSFTGEVLNAPATKNLIKFDLSHLEKAQQK
ncbi:MAG TPA: (2Fe-2S)-binding protein [Prolixibacteraceae bacterium]|jgi:glycine/D-amino acid oxidase-like deaminating enzyme/nitrite reductase/ring-hydroxylating ferredoxin subunit|nr:(2Fe-2S)-binding protein [Prolixibacteraceae bacterium]